MQAQFKVLSISHENAAVDVRELFHLLPDQARSLSTQIKEILGIEEVLVVSTCNRTEIYVAAEEADPWAIYNLLCIEKGLSSPNDFYTHFVWIEDMAKAAQHLFEVSMGLRSQVVGDLQISNQVKQAYALAAELQLAGPFLHRLLHAIFHTNKKVQQQTAYRDGAASLSYAAAILAKDLCMPLSQPKALVIGMGEMAVDVAKQLVSLGFEHITVTNRSQEKALAFAENNPVHVLPFEELTTAAAQYHVIVSAVSAKTPLLRADMFGQGSATRFIIDLSVPRTVSADLAGKAGMILYDMDEIKSKTDEVLRKRMAEVPKVRAIIHEDLHAFLDWSRELTISPTIQKLKDALEQIRQEEMAKFVKGMAQTETELMDKVTKSIMNKIIKLPVLQLKAACKRGEQETLIDLLNDLFDLEKAREAEHSL